MTSRSNRNHRLHLLAAATALALSSVVAAPAIAGQAHLAGLKADGTYSRFIVKYKNGSAPANSDVQVSSSLSSAASRAALPASSKGKKLGLRSVRRMMLPGAQVVASDVALNRDEAEAVMRQIAADSNVEFVQVDGIRHALAVPNDTRFGDQWHYADSAVGIRAPTAWNTSTGTGVVVAVIDSGILSHTDLNANILPGYDMVSSTTGFSNAECQQAGASPGCGKSDDGDGRDSNPLDSSNVVHGTHVAGTIAAVTNNGSGVAGVAYNAKVVPVRVLGNQGFGSDSDIADAIVWASGGTVAGVPANANPAEVINMSLGGDAPCSETPAYQAAINTAIANGSVVVAAAGNSNIDVAGATPASCDGVISVAASNKSGARSYYSSWGASIDITAPGGAQSFEGDPNGILSTVANNGYGYMQGTSMASPHVAGVIALMQAAAPTPKTSAQIQSILASTARPIPANKCTGGCGPGLIDAAAAVAAAAGTTPPTGTQTYTNGTDYNIPDNNATGVSSSITVSGRTGNAPSNASVAVNIVHPYKGDLIVDLIAPDGSVYNIHNRAGGSADNVSGTFPVNLSSETLNGTWKLRAADRAASDVGKIDTWSITF